MELFVPTVKVRLAGVVCKELMGLLVTPMTKHKLSSILPALLSDLVVTNMLLFRAVVGGDDIFDIPKVNVAPFGTALLITLDIDIC
jgi:hypothetical protein